MRRIAASERPPLIGQANREHTDLRLNTDRADHTATNLPAGVAQAPQPAVQPSLHGAWRSPRTSAISRSERSGPEAQRHHRALLLRQRLERASEEIALPDGGEVVRRYGSRCGGLNFSRNPCLRSS